MSRLSRAASIATTLALVPALTSATIHPASEEDGEGGRTGGSEGAFTEFVDASRETGGDAFILAALYRNCLDEGEETWMCADEDDDRISDGSDFHGTLEEMGEALNDAESNHTRDPLLRIDEGYSGGFTDEREEGEGSGDQNLREEAREAWIAAIEELPVEDPEDISEDVFELALHWLVSGALTEDCQPSSIDGSYSDDGDDDDADATPASASGTDFSIQPAFAAVPASNSSDIEIPEEYVEPLQDAADESGLPVELIAAQIQQESSWQEDAISPAGARGLTQFMRGTWAEWGEGDFEPYPDPIKAIEAQGRFMAHLMEHVEYLASNDEEQIELALAAYNAGPGAVDEHGGVPPFEETQHYVVTIPEMANEMGADMVIAASQGGCNSNYDIPDLDDVDCEAYEENTHRDYQGAREGSQPSHDGGQPYLERVMHQSAHPGLMCGMVAFTAEYDGALLGGGDLSPFGSGSSNDFDAGSISQPVPSGGLGFNDHPWGGGLDIALNDAEDHSGGQFYWTVAGQEYGKEIAEFYMEHAEELNVYLVIYWEKSWMATEDPKPWEEWSRYSAGGWSPQGGVGDSFGQEYSTFVEPGPSSDPGGPDNLAHRNHPHISFDPR